MNKELLVEIKNVYGAEKIYPKEPYEVARAIRSLTGKKTIDLADIEMLNILGITVKTKVFNGHLLEPVGKGGA